MEENYSKKEEKRVRKCSFVWGMELVQNLVANVEKHENLWNPCHHMYRDRIFTQNSWESVAAVLDVPQKEVITKWNSIRCNYRVNTRDFLNLYTNSEKFIHVNFIIFADLFEIYSGNEKWTSF